MSHSQADTFRTEYCLMKVSGFCSRVSKFSRTTVSLLRIPLQDHAWLKADLSEEVSSCCRDGLCKNEQSLRIES